MERTDVEERDRSYRVRQEMGLKDDGRGFALTRRQIGDIPANTVCEVTTVNAGFRGIEAFATAPDGTRATASLGAFDAIASSDGASGSGPMAATPRAGGNSRREILETVDLSLVVSFEPDAIRDHFEADDPNPVAGLTDEELRAIGHHAISSDSLWKLFHELLADAVEAHAAGTGGEVPA